MKATLEFDLPVDRDEFQDAQDGWRWKAVLEDFDTKLRNMAKYEDATGIDIEYARKFLRETCEYYNLKF